MKEAKRQALKTAGFQIGTVQEFLGLNDAEAQLVELRVQLSKAVRRRREAQKLTQQEVATRLKSSQSRVAKIEAGLPDVSLDLMFRCLFSVGGKLEDLDVESGASQGRTRKSASTVKHTRAPKGSDTPVS
jgi:predicted XRE-type DNA-binding protein